jgi:hypothetical protein
MRSSGTNNVNTTTTTTTTTSKEDGDLQQNVNNNSNLSNTETSESNPQQHKRKHTDTNENNTNTQAATSPNPSQRPPTQSLAPKGYHQDFTSKVQIKHKDGSIVPIHLEVFPFTNENGQQRYSMKVRRVALEDTVYHKGEKFIGEYRLLEVIGEGSSGKVKKAIHDSTNQLVSIHIRSLKPYTLQSGCYQNHSKTKIR